MNTAITQYINPDFICVNRRSSAVSRSLNGRWMAGMALALATLFAPVSARAQDYPSKPVRLVTAEVGGGHDLAARLIAQGLTANLGQQFIVENRAGAILAGQTVAK